MKRLLFIALIFISMSGFSQSVVCPIGFTFEHVIRNDDKIPVAGSIAISDYGVTVENPRLTSQHVIKKVRVTVGKTYLYVCIDLANARTGELSTLRYTIKDNVCTQLEMSTDKFDWEFKDTNILDYGYD